MGMKTVTRSLAAISICVLSGCSFTGNHSGKVLRFEANQDTTPDAAELSEEEENNLGRAVAAKILGLYKASDDDALNRYVNKVGLTLAAHSPRPNTFRGYSFIVIRSDEINAFAAPGGYIFISQGLLKKLKNEDELAAVLAHEITHVANKHSLKAIKPNHFTGFTEVGGKLASAIDCTGLSSQAIAAFNAAVEDIVDALLKSGYSKDQEFESDAGAYALLVKTGYQPHALHSVLALLKGSKGNGGWFSTHPSAEDRLVALEGAQLLAPTPAPEDPAFLVRTSRFEDVRP